MNVKIDSHQHFWNPKRGDYDWMPMDNEILARVYGPRDLEPHLLAAGIDQTVLVQAAATVEETEYMLGIADASPRIAGVHPHTTRCRHQRHRLDETPRITSRADWKDVNLETGVGGRRLVRSTAHLLCDSVPHVSGTMEGHRSTH